MRVHVPVLRTDLCRVNDEPHKTHNDEHTTTNQTKPNQTEPNLPGGARGDDP